MFLVETNLLFPLENLKACELCRGGPERMGPCPPPWVPFHTPARYPQT